MARVPQPEDAEEHPADASEPDQTAAETVRLPAGWRADAPRTWMLVRNIPVTVDLPDGATRLVWRELVTSAAEFGPVVVPSGDAAAWWATILRPIHAARVAAVRFPELVAWPERDLLPDDAQRTAASLADLAERAEAVLGGAGIGPG